MLNVYLWNKNEKMFQIDLDSDLKEEHELKSRCWFTLFGPVMKGSWICLNLLKYMPYYEQIYLDKCNQECNFVNMPEYE